MLKRLRRLSLRGDTIVEVLVVLTVLGLAISISYATANRSLLDARQAQENSQGTELAQAQIEALRTLTQVGDTPDIFTQPGAFCLSQTPPYTIPASCNISGGAFNYAMAVVYTNTAASPDTFTVTVTWPDVEGQGNDTVTLVYRIYQQS